MAVTPGASLAWWPSGWPMVQAGAPACGSCGPVATVAAWVGAGIAPAQVWARGPLCGPVVAPAGARNFAKILFCAILHCAKLGILA